LPAGPAADSATPARWHTASPIGAHSDATDDQPRWAEGPKRKLSKRTKGPAKFGVRDILTLALCLAAAAALQLGSEPLMAMVPQKHQSNAWIVFGGVFASGVYALVRLTNERAISIDRALARLLFDVEEPRSLASAALVFAVGTVASMQAGPMGAS